MAVRFTTDVPQTLIFPFGDFREVEGQHGLQFLYTVQTNGDPREKLYATPALHRELQAAGVAAGTLFTITKLDGTGSRYWRVEDGPPAPDGDEPLGEAAPVGSDGLSAQPSEATRTTAAKLPGLDELERLLGSCVAASARVCRSLNGEARFTTEDVRRLGTTLFLECSRRGVRPDSLR